MISDSPRPGSIVYAATKRYDAVFGELVAWSIKEHKKTAGYVDSLIVKPGLVRTALLENREYWGF